MIYPLRYVLAVLLVFSILISSPSVSKAADISKVKSKITDLSIVEDKKRFEEAPEVESQSRIQATKEEKVEPVASESAEASPSASPTLEPTSPPITLADKKRSSLASVDKPDTIISLDIKAASDEDVDALFSKLEELTNEGKQVTYVDGGKVKTYFFFAYNSDDKLAELKQEFKNNDALKVSENRIYKSQYTPNDTIYSLQKNLPLIDYSGALDLLGGAGRPIIAVMDNGVNVDETDLNPNIYAKSSDTYGDGIDNDSNGYIDDTYGCNFYKYNRSGGASSCLKASLFDSSCTNIGSSCNHGLWASEIIAAKTNNAYGMAAICPNCRIMVLDVDDTGGAYISDIISGINYAVNNGANVINFSYTSSCPFDASGDVLNPYINAAVNTYKVNYVQSAGNQGAMDQATCNSSCSGNPYCASSARNEAYYYIDGKATPNKLIVAATDNSHARASFSNYNGSSNQSVNISAPGSSIAVAINNNSTTISGTSFSAPQVAGAAGLALTYLLPKYTPTAEEVVEILTNTGRKISTDKNISGRELDLAKSMQLAAARGTVYGTSSVFVSRFWSPTRRSHFYTANDREGVDIRNNYPDSMWTYEGTAFYGFATQVANTVPVYRFYSNRLSTHFYTANYDEMNTLVNDYPDDVWKLEGIAWYTYPLAYTGQSTLVYRFWSPSLGRHFFTSDTLERDYLISINGPFKYEGPVWRNP